MKNYANFGPNGSFNANVIRPSLICNFKCPVFTEIIANGEHAIAANSNTFRFHKIRISIAADIRPARDSPLGAYEDESCAGVARLPASVAFDGDLCWMWT
jgi:hypothetical protein